MDLPVSAQHFPVLAQGGPVLLQWPEPITEEPYIGPL